MIFAGIRVGSSEPEPPRCTATESENFEKTGCIAFAHPISDEPGQLRNRLSSQQKVTTVLFNSCAAVTDGVGGGES